MQPNFFECSKGNDLKQLYLPPCVYFITLGTTATQHQGLRLFRNLFCEKILLQPDGNNAPYKGE